MYAHFTFTPELILSVTPSNVSTSFDLPLPGLPHIKRKGAS
jgi:hypothetical protein